jgi:cbb3-type cytochrome oxidase subunit 3
MEQLTGVIGVLTGFMTVVLSLGIVFWAIYWNHQKKRLQYQERQLMIEKGMTPPPVLPEQDKKTTPQDSLRRGTVLVFLGLGLGVAAPIARMLVEDELGGLLGVAAAIVAFIGFGNLVFYFIAHRHQGAEARENSATPV